MAVTIKRLWEAMAEGTEDELEEEEAWFRFSATLRIFGDNLNFEEISQTLELEPTHTHRKGENVLRRPSSVFKPYAHDGWLYTVPVPKEHELGEHLAALWSVLKPHKQYLLELKKTYTVNISCGYRSNNGTAGFDLPYQALEIFTELQMPFGVSVII